VHELPGSVLWIVLLPAIAAVVQHFLGARLPRKGDWLIVGAMGASLVLSVMTMFAWIGLEPGGYFAKSWTWVSLAGVAPWKLGIVVDGLTSAMLCVVTLVAFLVFLFSTAYMHGDPRYERFFFWLSFFAVSMLLLVVADHLILLFIGWELVGLCSYKLIGFWSHEIPNAEAAKKAFITTRIGDVGMLLGMLVLYRALGTLQIREIFAGVAEGKVSGAALTWAGIGIFFGAVGKSAQFPLHVWLPDAMAGPTPVSALIHAATMVAAGVYLSARMFPIFTPDALDFIAWTGAISALLTAIVAVTQTDIKKVLAYSTMSQLGFMILGVGVGSPWAAMFHLCTHALFKACLFLGSGSVIHAMHHAQDLKDMGGLRRKMPVTFWTFVVSTLALAGIPLTSGFLSKDAILAKAVHEHRTVLFVMGFAAAFLTAFYMTRLVWLCFLGRPRNEHKFEHAHESPVAMTAPLVILAAFSIGLVWSGFNEKFLRTPAYIESFPEASHHAYVKPGAQAEHEHHSPLFMICAIGIAVGGVATGVAVFRSGRRDHETRLLPPRLHELAKNKYYLDDFYLDGFIAMWNRISAFCAGADAKVVDGTVNAVGRGSLLVGDLSGDADQVIVDGAVNLAADVAQGAGAVVSTAQNGRIRNYLGAAIGITAAAVVLLLLVL